MKSYSNQKNYLLLFFILTLSWTWICGLIPTLLGNIESPIGSFIFYFGAGAPSVVGLFLVCLTYSKKERIDYFKRCFSLRKMGWRWPLWTAGLFLSITVTGLFLAVNLLGQPLPEMDWIQLIFQKPYTIPVVLILSYLSGPINEEFGWRGYSIDHLLIRFGFVKTNLILGTIWTIWHLFWFMNPQQSQYYWIRQSFLDALIYLPATILLCFVVSIVYIKTNRSILAGATVHMMRNLFTSQLLSPVTVEVSTILKFSEIIFFAAVTLYFLSSDRFKIQLNHSIQTIEHAYYKESSL